MTKFREGDVLRYKIREGQSDWCREGMAIVYARTDDTLFALDTYWASMGDAHLLTDDELETAEAEFNLNDVEPIAHRGAELQWETYDPDDRFYYTSQHRLQSHYFIRKGAVPSLEQKIENAKEKVEKRERELESAQWALDWARRDLDDLIAQRDGVQSEA